MQQNNEKPTFGVEEMEGGKFRVRYVILYQNGKEENYYTGTLFDDEDMAVSVAKKAKAEFEAKKENTIIKRSIEV